MVKTTRRVGWYGKLPARGDFVSRGLPPRWRSEWDEWLQRGLVLAANRMDKEDLRQRLANFAAWRYLARAASGEAWCGIVVASQDRVGRAFPLTLAERLGGPVAASACAARLAALLDAAAEGPDALETAIAALPPSAPQDVSSAEPWPQAQSSLWWPLAAGPEVAPLAASWPPEPELLLQLLAF